VRDDLLVRAAVRGVPRQVGQVGGLVATRVGQLLVVEEPDGVEVLRQAVALAVLALPQVGEPRLVLVRLEAVLGQGRVEVDELVLVGELTELREVVGEDVGSVLGHEAVGELAPVVVPRVLADLDRDVRVRGVERVRARLVGRELVGVPQPVVDLPGRGAGVERVAVTTAAAAGVRAAATAGGEGEAQGCEADEHGPQLLARSCHRWHVLSV
jgi:hypothetical protein